MSQTIPEYAGCPWPVDPACFSDDWAVMEDSVKERSVALASSTLHRLTGERVTNCPITIRPNAGVGGACYIPTYGSTGPFSPGMDTAGRWVNNCGPACGNPRLQVRLPRPVGEIVLVLVDGEPLYPTDTAVVDGNLLVYRGTGSGFPASQDITLPSSAPGTMEVTYYNGYRPDALAAYAAGMLAMEYAKACTGKGCKLPTGVTSIVRQGVSLEVSAGSFPNGMTGIREVDTFIALWNPNNQRPSRIIVPGAPGVGSQHFGGFDV